MLTVLKVFYGYGLNVLFFPYYFIFFFCKVGKLWGKTGCPNTPLILFYMMLIDN